MQRLSRRRRCTLQSGYLSLYIVYCILSPNLKGVGPICSKAGNKALVGTAEAVSWIVQEFAQSSPVFTKICMVLDARQPMGAFLTTKSEARMSSLHVLLSGNALRYQGFAKLGVRYAEGACLKIVRINEDWSGNCRVDCVKNKNLILKR